MSRSEDHERFPEDLQEVAEVLRERRPSSSRLELDRIKLRAMSGARRSTASQQGGFSMRSRLVAFLTVGMLAVGTGSAVAVFSSSGGGVPGSSANGSAAHHEYKPPCKDGEHFGDDHRCKKDKGKHHWEHHHGWCWQDDGHGGWKWGYGDGWVYV